MPFTLMSIFWDKDVSRKQEVKFILFFGGGEERMVFQKQGGGAKALDDSFWAE